MKKQGIQEVAKQIASDLVNDNKVCTESQDFEFCDVLQRVWDNADDCEAIENAIQSIALGSFELASASIKKIINFAADEIANEIAGDVSEFERKINEQEQL